MPRQNYEAVRVLTISEIVEAWTDHAVVPSSTLERELRISVLSLAPDRDWQTDGLIPLEELPSDDELPPVTTRLTREHVVKFCLKQKSWALPTFWFPPETPEVRRRGRPSDSAAIVQELERRSQSGEMLDTVSAESRALSEWLSASAHANMQPKSIENMIRKEFNRLKSDSI